jgi:hypothetical protein
MPETHSIEYELTSELASDIHQTLVRWQFRRGWRRDIPMLAGASVLGALIVWLSLRGWIVSGVGGALLGLLVFLVLGAIFRRWSIARGTALMAILPLHTSDRRVRIEFGDERIRLEAEFFCGDGAWSELEEVVIFPGYWLLELSNGGHIVLPGRFISSELETFIRGKARDVTAPIHDG